MLSKILPSRIPILYVILSVLVLISVVPMSFYSAQVQSINRERLITNERLLQNTLTQAIADDISQHQESFRLMQQRATPAPTTANLWWWVTASRSIRSCWSVHRSSTAAGFWE